jgi:hypothetical protein
MDDPQPLRMLPLEISEGVAEDDIPPRLVRVKERIRRLDQDVGDASPPVL